MTDYWLTPPKMLKELEAEFGKMFDPCPYPRADFDGLEIEWRDINYVNPPFRGRGSWMRKALKEFEKGKRIVMILPMHTPEAIIFSKAQIRHYGKIAWGATDGSGSKVFDDNILVIL